MLLFIFFLQLVFSEENKGTTEGDQDPWWKECNLQCNQQLKCEDPDNEFEKSKGFILTLTFWDCSAECQYACTRKHNQQRIERGEKIVQYYGKWPFVRIFGFQEIASSLFSIGNLIPHVLAVINYGREVPKSYYLKNVFMANAILGCFTWSFSAIFHCRDVEITELLDYSFASLTFFMGSFLAILRIFELKGYAYYGVCLFFFLWIVQHWRYMFFVKFDYDYNMGIGVLNGVFVFIAWACWYIFKARFEPNSEHSYKVVVAYAFMGLAGTMELFDFPPILEVIDPHSLWHLGTIPCFFVLLDFYLQDSLYEEKKEAKRRHHIV